MKAIFLHIFLLMGLVAFAQPKPSSAPDRLKSNQQKSLLLANSTVNNTSFQNIGPSVMSGRVVDIDVNPSEPTEFYVAYATGGVWHTINNGQSFKPIFDSTATLNIGDIAVNWKNRIIWVGTGEANSSRSSYAGIGVYKSDNNGKIKLALEPLTFYNVEVNKEGYETKKLNIATGDTEKNIALTQKKAVVTDDAIVIENIYFDFNKYDIKREGTVELDRIINLMMNVYPRMVIKIESHTDSRGSASYNLSLSERRALTTAQYVISKGIDATRITGSGKGETIPSIDCGGRCTEEEHQLNRRSEFLILSGNPNDQ